MMTRTIAAAALTTLTLSALPASAEEATAAAPAPIVIPARVERALARPAALPALYASFAALQVYDVYSTGQALKHGGREVNPLMQGVVGNQGAFWALKAGVTAGTILAAERLWKTNKAAAIGVMVASNGVAALVAARNARTLRQVR